MIKNKDKVKELLLKQVHSSNINYRYFLTLDYPYKQTNYNKVLLDNKYLRKFLRKFFKCDLKMIMFIEKHTDPSSNHFGGYHRHVLLQEIPAERWLDPTGGMMTFLLSMDAEAAFGVRMGAVPPTRTQERLLKKVVRDLVLSVPNGFVGSNVTTIEESKGGVEGLIGYLTKQTDRYHPAYELIDPTSSDVDIQPILGIYNGANKITRYERISSAIS